MLTKIINVQDSPRKRYSSEELKVIINMKCWNYAVDMQLIRHFLVRAMNAYLEHDNEGVVNNSTEFFNRIESLKQKFDTIYLSKLYQSPVNPLKLEQNAWRLLSPSIEQGIRAFQEKLEEVKYKLNDDTAEELFDVVDTSNEIIDKMEIISELYKVKYGIALAAFPRNIRNDDHGEVYSLSIMQGEDTSRDYAILPKLEQAVLDLITTLQHH